MASFFVDWDGTIARFGTGLPLEGALETLALYLQEGHQVIITTARTDLTEVKYVLKKARLSRKIQVLGGIQNPRVVINDMGAYAVNHSMDAPWNYEDLADLPVQPIL